MQITDKDLQQFRERAKTELQSNGAVGRLAWDSVVDALCDEVEELRKNAAPGNFAAKWLYRLEYHDGTCGLWYDGSGNWCFERGIGSLDDSCKTKSLPMDYDERYRQDGRSWFSSCSRKEDLLHWYSREDAKRLLSHGFVFTRYLATEYREYDQQTVFIKETCLYREEIDFESLWKSSSPGNAAAITRAQLQTIADLVSIAHDEYDGCPSYRDDLERFDRVLAEIKAEAQSAPGNAAALREAAERICSIDQPDTQDLRQLAQFCHDQSIYGGGLIERVLDDIEIVRQALSVPPRNCDVGTAEEQAERFKQFCLDNHSAEHLCSRCPLGKRLGNDVDMCQLHWAQMPFDPAEGGAE